jgi:nitrate/TMAO reductase-like tetraheme cytochrome c subunit
MRNLLSPFVYLSSNLISRIGVVLVTTAGVLFLALLPTIWRGETQNPYTGILIFLLLPVFFVAGLMLIPLGIWLKRRRVRESGEAREELPLTWANPDLRRLVVFIGLTTFVNLIIAAQLSYSAVTYMESTEFCGLTCHTVMKPEHTAYQNSPHARVTCVQCHIGEGADWFVKSKLSGAWQVISVTFNLYSRPIPTPVHNLRPARETCEACHWPQKFGGDRLRVLSSFADDETNTESKTVLLMHIGGGNRMGPGIHGVHLGPGVEIRYRHSDEARQTIPWVEYKKPDGSVESYIVDGVTPEALQKMPLRLMDCMDCHNRPSHTFELPERALNHAMENHEVSRALPFSKKTALELLKRDYQSEAEAARTIPAAFAEYYQKNHPTLFASKRDEIERSGKAVYAIWARNVFPEMRVTWGSYPNNAGHQDFPGCFRCHDDEHKSKSGKTVGQDCNSCHSLLAMEETDPKVLKDLGFSGGQ